MKAKLLLLVLATFLLIPALAASPIISNSLVCDGVSYPACSPGGSCLDPCCYCECRAQGIGPGICSFDCCQGH